MNPDDLSNHAVLIIGTSFAKSTWRAILRDFTKEHWEEYGSIAPHVHTKFNVMTYKDLRDIIKQLKKKQ